MGRSRLVSWLLTATAVLIGFLLGFFRILPGPQEASDPAASDRNASRSENGEVQPFPQLGEESMAATRKRLRTAGGGEMGCSRKQWRMSQDDPALLQIDLGQCLAWQGVREVPIVDYEGFAPVGMRMHMDDSAADGWSCVAALSSWIPMTQDEMRLLSAALDQAARARRDWEDSHVKVTAIGPGEWTVFFPGDGGMARQNLDASIEEILGAERASQIEILGNTDGFLGMKWLAPGFRHGQIRVLAMMEKSLFGDCDFPGFCITTSPPPPIPDGIAIRALPNQGPPDRTTGCRSRRIRRFARQRGTR